MNRKILKLAVPSILANITVPLVGMVDLAIAGRIGDAVLIGGIAVGTMLFDLLYWNLGFLRVGTGGLTAQAYGRRDFKDAIRYFGQGLLTAIGLAMIIWLIQKPFLKAAFLLVESGPEMTKLALAYFNVRIWAAPATLSLLVFKGWFIGMQNTVSPMIIDIFVNVLNLVGSAYFALATPMGIAGIALGTVIAQYSGLLLAVTLFIIYYRKLFRYFDIRSLLNLKDYKHFFSISGDLFIRSICFLCVYTGFTSIASNYGELMLAVSTIMMKLMLLYSYFIDGFAYAGEALTGRYVGARDMKSLKLSVKWLFIWCLGIAAASTMLYGVGGEWLVRFLTPDPDVIAASKQFLYWLYLMPILSCIAFTWDGVYIGATSSKALRNAMVLSAIAFFVTYYIFRDIFGIQALWMGFAAHLIVRSIHLTLTAKKNIFTFKSVV